MQIAILKSEAQKKINVEKIRRDFDAEQIGIVDYQLADPNLKAQLDEDVYSYASEKERAFFTYLSSIGIFYRELKPQF